MNKIFRLKTLLVVLSLQVMIVGTGLVFAYPGTNNSGGVVTQYLQPATFSTTLAGVAGMDDLYSQNPSDGEFAILDSDGTPIVFRYSGEANVFVRVSPLGANNQNLFVNDTNSNGIRVAAASNPEWDLTDYSFSSGAHTLTASGASSFIFEDDIVPNLSEVGFIVIHKALVETGATDRPIFDLRDNNGATTTNLRLFPIDGTWQLNSSSFSDTGVAYSTNTEYSFEVYYDYVNSRATVYYNYSATPTTLNNSSIILPTTGATSPMLALQNDDGVLNFEAFGAGELLTEL